MSRLFERPPSPLQIRFLSVLDGGPEHCHERIKSTGLYSNALGLTPPSAGVEQQPHIASLFRDYILSYWVPAPASSVSLLCLSGMRSPSREATKINSCIRREAKPNRTKCCPFRIRDDCLIGWLWPLCFKIAVQGKSASGWNHPHPMI